MSHDQTTISPRWKEGLRLDYLQSLLLPSGLESREQIHCAVSSTSQKREALVPRAEEEKLRVLGKNPTTVGRPSLPGPVTEVQPLHRLPHTQGPGQHLQVSWAHRAPMGRGAVGVTVLRAERP